MAENDSSVPKLGINRTVDFQIKYANNIRFESSVWDLKLIFGLLDQASDPSDTRFHTSVNVPWAQAKMAAYTLLVNVLMHETYYGTKIELPSGLIPTPVEDVVKALKEIPEYADTLHALQTAHKVLFGVSNAVKKDADRPSY